VTTKIGGSERESTAGGPPVMAARLRDLIVDGRFPAGARLTEREIGAIFGCSAAAVREILHFLEKEGAVSLSARKGARVMDPRSASPADVLSVWNVLHPLLAQEMARKGIKPGPGKSPAQGVAASARLRALEGRLARIGKAVGNEKLVSILARAALHLAIVAPERFGELEAELAE
jgi:DNA-binding GntR family transcriptional regulator